ncbi:MAG: Zn(2+)-responsive transcriptional regulator [Gammaproteobacteria bacterium]|nr:MAG: Zn(2+)-responsive transcriptional regulator [Pseudomonadota bacterium]PIE38773.1 MAG: Zn(2+)-responsive transcriptional regulator [Gammaproteobacteria bacterium]
MATYRIGQAAKELDVSVHTLRYYEKHGYLRASGRTESNYRIYTESDLDSARFIVRARKIGFSLNEIQTFLSIRANKDQHTCREAKAIAQAKIEEVTQKIHALQQMLSDLHQLSDACCGGKESAENCTILKALDHSKEDLP